MSSSEHQSLVRSLFSAERALRNTKVVSRPSPLPPSHRRSHPCAPSEAPPSRSAATGQPRARDGIHREKLNPWVVEKFKKLNQARSQLYRSQILQVNTRWN